MINNKAKNMYHAIKAMPIEDNSKAKSKKKGLLAPVRNFMKKKDKTKAGYWACRAHKDFGNNVPGRFW